MMRKSDRSAWASAGSLKDLGDRVASWLNGGIQHTPAHMGPPDPETIPHVPVLTRANRAGFVTDNSQSATTRAEAAKHRGWRPSNAWVSGYADDAAKDRLHSALTPPLRVEQQCRGREHSGHGGRSRLGRWWRCPRRSTDSFWTDRAPLAARDIRKAWYLTAADPEVGRNDRLWPALERFAAPAPARDRSEPERKPGRTRGRAR